MPFPIAIVGVVGGVVGVVGVVGAAMHEDHSDHSDYSDAAYREEQARKKQEEERKRNLANAEAQLESTLKQMKNSIADELRAQGIDPRVIENWNPGISNFRFSDFEGECASLDADAKSRIRQAVDAELGRQIQARQDELDLVNNLIRKVNETRLTGK